MNMSWKAFCDLNKENQRLKLERKRTAYRLCAELDQLKKDHNIKRSGRCKITDRNTRLTLAKSVTLSNSVTLVDVWIGAKVKKGTNCTGVWKGQLVTKVVRHVR